MTEIQLPELGEVAELIRTTREERAWLKKLFRLLQEARRLGIQVTSPEGPSHAE